MSDAEHPRDAGSWLRFLESQIANRDSEIALLRAEIQDKGRSHLAHLEMQKLDTERLLEMTDALASASLVIRNLEGSLSEARESESRLNNLTEELERNLRYAHDEIEQDKNRPFFHRPAVVGGAFGVLIGVVTVAFVLGFPLFRAEKPTKVVSADNELVARPNALAAKLLPEAEIGANNTSDADDVTVPEDDGKITREVWIETLGVLRKAALGVDASELWAQSLEFKDVGEPVVVTRAQFRDVVSKNLPTALPSGVSDGLFLYDIGQEDADKVQLVASLKEEKVASASLCKPWDTDPSNFRRLSIVVSNSLASVDCLNRLVNSQWFRNQWSEVTVVSITSSPIFAASYFSEKKFFSFQEWKQEWITQVTVGSESDKWSNSQVRAKRLAAIARVLSTSSDVRVEVPVGDARWVSFGNFAVIPASLPTGPLRATRLSVATGRPTGKAVTQPIAPNARAVIINGSEGNSAH
jgi:hypothetical protein